MKHVANLILMVVSIVIAVAVAEVALRFVGITPGTGRLDIYEFDERLGWKTVENTKYYRSSPYYGHFNYYGPHGFPVSSDNMNVSYSTSTRTLALVGDSYVEGYYVPYEHSFAHLLDVAFPDIQTVNLGVSGYAPDQYLLRARKHMPTYNVEDIVVVFFPYNDVRDVSAKVYQGYAKPYFADPLAEPTNLPLALETREEEKGLVKRLIHSSAVYTIARPVVRTLFPINDPQQQSKAYTYEDFETSMTLISRIHAENASSSFHVYYMPTVEEYIETDSYENNIAHFTAHCEAKELACGHLVLPVDTPAEIREYYIEGDGHLSVEGSAVVAKQLADMLEEPAHNL